jgi:hypothetical protein
MDEFVLRCWQVTMTASVFCVVVAACARWVLGSRSTPTRKPKPSPEATPTSETHAALAAVQADQAVLFSTLEKLTTTIKRLSSRAGMREIREREQEDSNSAPPVGATKAELLRHYGLAGKVGPAFAQAQLELEHRRPPTERTN